MAGTLHLLLHFFLSYNVILFENFEDILASFLSSWKGRKIEEQGRVSGLHFETCRCKTTVFPRRHCESHWRHHLNPVEKSWLEVCVAIDCGWLLFVDTEKVPSVNQSLWQATYFVHLQLKLRESTSLKEHICSLYT